MAEMEVEIVQEVFSARGNFPFLIPEEFRKEWDENTQFIGKYVEFMKYMLRSEKLSDITFILTGHCTSNEVKVKAHRCMLRQKSQFFKTLFSDRWEQQEVINLANSGFNDEEFRCFLEYLYTEKIELTKNNVLVQYHLANLYLGENNNLKQMCESFLEDKIDNQNVFMLYEAVCRYDLDKNNALLRQLIDYICKDGERLLDSGDMKLMDMARLSMIFKSGDFKCSRPMRLLRFALEWIEYHNGRKALWDYADVDRRIREEFKMPWDVPRLQRCLNTAANSETTSGSITRFKHTSSTPNGWTYRPKRADRISFRVSVPIILKGLGFYASKEFDPTSPQHSRYDIDISVYTHGKQRNEVLSIFRRGGDDFSHLSRTFKVDVDPTYLHADSWYTIAVKISGIQKSYFGLQGKEEELCQCGKTPLVFEFKEASDKDDNAKLANATGVPIGQIPEIYFDLASIGGDDDIKML